MDFKSHYPQPEGDRDHFVAGKTWAGIVKAAATHSIVFGGTLASESLFHKKPKEIGFKSKGLAWPLLSRRLKSISIKDGL